MLFALLPTQVAKEKEETNSRLLNILVVLLVRHFERLHDSNGSL